MKKKLIAACSMLAAMTCLAACGTSGGGGSSKNTIKIDFVEAGFGREFLNQWIAEFKKVKGNENYNFVLDGNPDMSQDFLTRLQTGTNLPDLALLLESPWQKHALQNRLEPLNDVYDSVIEDNKKLSEIMDETCLANSRLTRRGQTNYYTVPWSSAPSGIVYNVDMFTNNGWTVPTTTKELIELCDQINEEQKSKPNPIKPITYASGQTAYWEYVVDTWWIQYEGMDGWKTFWDLETKDCFDQEGRKVALEMFATLSQNKYCEVETTIQASQKAFIDGKAAMTVNASWLQNEMKAQIEESGINMGLMKTPVIDDAMEDFVLYNPSDDYICIPTKAANKEGAKKFLKFINTKKCCEIFAKEAGGFRPLTHYDPTQIQGLTSFIKGCAQLEKDAKEQEKYASRLISNPMFYANTGADSCSVWPGYGTPYTKMLQLGETPDDVMNNVAATVDMKWSIWEDNAGR